MTETTLNAGRAIHALLTSSEEVMSMATRVFPVVARDARLPYVAYRRAAMDVKAIKVGAEASSATIQVRCYAETYEESVTLAEAVRTALDFRQGDFGDLYLRSCLMTSAEEFYEGDAFVQHLEFKIKIQNYG